MQEINQEIRAATWASNLRNRTFVVDQGTAVLQSLTSAIGRRYAAMSMIDRRPLTGS